MKTHLFFALCLTTLFETEARADLNPYPSDWISHEVSITDTRTKAYRAWFDTPHIEIIELPYTAPRAQAGTLLMIPGLFQNAASFDLLPEENISLGRYLMNKFGLQIYFLHVRGLGHSGGSRKLNLDDFAIDDIPAAVRWIKERELGSLYVFGHSQGAIMVQASFAGLTRCELKNCFDEITAKERQKGVSGIALSAGSVSMATAGEGNRLPFMGDLGHFLQGPMKFLFDRIEVSDLVQVPFTSGLSHTKLFEFLYHRENTSQKAETALYQRTLEASWSRVILQFAEGVRNKNISAQSESPDAKPETYVSGQKNIQIPLVQVTYGVDPMAEPKPTRETSFNAIGSAKKKFFVFEGQGHEDYFMEASLHHDWDEPLDWLMDQ